MNGFGTGTPIEFFYYRNMEKAPYLGDRFAQDIEPTGEYMGLLDEDPGHYLPKYEYGRIKFNNPLVLEHKTTGHGGWKTDLSVMFSGKTGKRLTDAIRQAGYDGIVTWDETGTSETVNITGEKTVLVMDMDRVETSGDLEP